MTGRLGPDATGDVESTATITPEATLADVDESDNTSVATATVVAADTVAHVETDKSVTPAQGVAPGDEVEYLVTARNRGPAAAAEVGAVDELPAAMRFAGSPDDCTADGQVVTCRSGRSLAAGGSVDFRIRAVLDPAYVGDGSDVVNVATATSPTDPDGGDESPGVSIGVVEGGDGGPTAVPTGRPRTAPDRAPVPDATRDPATRDPAPRDGRRRTRWRRSGGRAGSAHADWPPRLTGVQDLGLSAAVSGVLAAAGAAAWWAVRRRRHGAVDDTGDAVSDVVRR